MIPLLHDYLHRSINEIRNWQNKWFTFSDDESLNVDPEKLESTFQEFISRLQGSYPFFHPSYIGQMLKPPHPIAMLAYFTAMQTNPNNHALDGGPSTSEMEKEAVAEIARMFGYNEYLGHLTSSGTIANLEALWIARELHPEKSIAFSEQEHYTHRRMCDVIRTKHVEIPADTSGVLDVGALRERLYSEDIGTVVVTLGTTALGAVEPLHEIMKLRSEFNFRIHVDAAYGGFFNLLAHEENPIIDALPFSCLSQCDSIVIDPHKHGLQPYGCGCILFRDPSVGRFYKHDSPYTYFTSKELHLGEISLECSRAGASAAALWFTLKCIPLKADEGLGAILRQCRLAALEWCDLIRTSSEMYLVVEPMVDIVAFFPRASEMRASTISHLSEKLFDRAMNDPLSPKYLSTLRLKTSILRARYPEIVEDSETTTVLRCVLMKPEHRRYIKKFHHELEEMIQELKKNVNL